MSHPPCCDLSGREPYSLQVLDERQAEVHLPGEAASVPAARHFVRGALTGWGQEARLDDAVLVLSELITNAVLHAHGDVVARVSVAADGSVQLEVLDSSGRLPRVRGYGDESTTGRGLRMVADLSEDWGVEPSDGGKRVWARLLPGSGAA